MYKYKQTTDVEIGDLVVWTELLPNNPHITKDKVYQVIDKINNNLVTVLSDNNTEVTLGKAQGFKVLQTKPASEAIVGDYMYRITSGSDAFPQHTIIKITKITPNYLYYKAGQSVLHDEVIVIAQTEQTSEYPVFKEDKVFGFIFKYTDLNEGIYLTNKGIPRRKPGDYSPSMIPRHSDCWKPCDFTIQPDIDDIDWWQARYEEELPVYVRDGSGPVYQCIALPPKDWSKCCTFGMTYSSLLQQAPTIPKSAISFALYPSGAPSDLTQTTTKEQPMKLQQLLDVIFGVSDYEAKPKFIVTVFNNDKEVGTTTAESVEEIQQTIQSDTRLWGCKLVAYKIHSELQTQVPVAITKFKKESNA